VTCSPLAGPASGQRSRPSPGLTPLAAAAIAVGAWPYSNTVLRASRSPVLLNTLRRLQIGRPGGCHGKTRVVFGRTMPATPEERA
jgi:hypothetical protein